MSLVLLSRISAESNSHLVVHGSKNEVVKKEYTQQQTTQLLSRFGNSKSSSPSRHGT
jgi:hypothetical protein